MKKMEDVKIRYKSDKYGIAMLARVVWKRYAPTISSRPIALIFHGGGLIVGSADIVPKPQIEYLCSSGRGFVVVIPNFRLVPQVTGKDAYRDCVDAYDWASTELVQIMKREHDIEVDPESLFTMGHSIGGTIALHVASERSVKAITAFYPTLSIADSSSSGHKSTSAPPFGLTPDFVPTEQEQATITPPEVQLSEANLTAPGTAPPPRNRWQVHLLKTGKWLSTLCPDDDYQALDPLSRVTSQWPPTMLVQGEADDVPGSSLELAEKSVAEMKAAGAADVHLVKVPGETHMFDLAPTVGTSDLGPRWETVEQGLRHLVLHAYEADYHSNLCLQT